MVRNTTGALGVIGVIGGSSCPENVNKLAEEVGAGIARGGAILICGGLGGVMESACKGAKGEGGLTLGVLPGFDRDDANEYVDIAIATGLSLARNLIIINTADVIIAIDGSYGTLSELAFALNLNKPVIALETWYLESAGKVDDELFYRVDSPQAAVELAFRLLSDKK